MHTLILQKHLKYVAILVNICVAENNKRIGKSHVGLKNAS